MTDAMTPEMTADIIQKKAVDAMIAMNAAIRTIHLYPISSAACTNAIDKAYGFFRDLLEKTGEAVFAESEKRLLICRQPLSESDLQKPQVSAFLALLLDFEIREISVQKGMEQEEFGKFLEIISTKPNTVREKGGLQKIVSETGLKHVRIDQKRFVSLDKDQEIGAKGNTNVEIQQIYGPMVQTLDSILDMENKDRVSRCLASSIAKKDEDFLTGILIQKTEGDMSRQLFQHLIDELDEQQFEKLIFRIRQMVNEEKGSSDTADEKENTGSDKKSAVQTIRNMLDTPKGRMLQKRLREKKAKEQESKIRQAERLRAGISSILNDEEKAFSDKEVMTFLPGAIHVLFSRKQNAAAEKLIDRLGDGLLSKDPKIRRAISQALTAIIRQSPPERKSGIIRRLSYPMSDWVKTEKETGPEFGQICVWLKEMAKGMIRKQRFDECAFIIEALHRGCGEKDPDILRELASDDIMDILLAEFMAHDTERRRQGARMLSRLGSPSAESLLHLLKKSRNRYERARILKTVSDIGAEALPCLEKEIRLGKPWYYMRNLILLFGKTGKESHTDILLPFLKDRDIRVRRECLNSIFVIAGKKREKIFLSLLSHADGEIKMNVVRLLGRMKSRAAVAPLAEMLESKTLLSSKHRSVLEEKICTALGHIATAEAVAALENIRDSEQKKRLLSRASDIEKRKAAAEKALRMIQQSI